jgi:hypothetical protein
MGKSNVSQVENKQIIDLGKHKQVKISPNILLTAKMTESKQEISIDEEKKE